jgi:uncharacterized protein (DUF58 family)
MAAPLLLDREFLKTLERVTLLCRTDLSGPVGADHRSRSHGPGLEYADYRRYSSGDDPRYLDWNAYLRLGKLFLKIYETERHVPVRILLDHSESMGYDDATKAKFLYAQRLAATFAYLALLHLDTVSVIPFADRIGKPIIVSGGRDSFWPVLEYLAALSCGGSTRLHESVKDFLRNFSTLFCRGRLRAGYRGVARRGAGLCFGASPQRGGAAAGSHRGFNPGRRRDRGAAGFGEFNGKCLAL